LVFLDELSNDDKVSFFAKNKEQPYNHLNRMDQVETFFYEPLKNMFRLQLDLNDDKITLIDISLTDLEKAMKIIKKEKSKAL
jgi:hypothetical protein